MTKLTSVLWFLSVASMLISTAAFVAVLRSQAHTLRRKLSEHSLMLEDLSHQLRNVRSRINMQAYRQRKKGQAAESSPGENGEDEVQTGKTWKDRMNLQLALRGLPK